MTAVETLPDMSEYEEGHLTMTALVYAVLDEVVRYMIGKLRDESEMNEPNPEEDAGQEKRGGGSKGEARRRKPGRAVTERQATRRSARRSRGGDTTQDSPGGTTQDSPGGTTQVLPGASGAMAMDEEEDVPEIYEYPVAEPGQLPLDSPDTVASHVSLNAPYDHHSDTRPVKPCNHNNKNRWSHEDQMRILTHGKAMSGNGVTAPVPWPLVSMR